MKKKIVSILFAIILIFALKNTCDAASASISCDSTATVGEKMTINVTGSAVQWNLELKVNGETIAKNSEVDNVDGNKNISFSGEYTPTKEGNVEVTLTGTVTEASDGSTIRSFTPKTVTVKAPTPTTPSTPDNTGNTGNTSDNGNTSTPKSTDARLANLGITPNDFKGFKKDLYEYSVEIPSNVGEVTVYAEPVKGAKVTSGTGKVSLKEGESKTVKIGVTAEDGKTTKTYTLTIKRRTVEEETKESSEARLTSLGIKPEEYDFSGFKSDKTDYAVEIPNDVKEIEIYATAMNAKAQINGIGKISLQDGKNTLNVEVIAEDGTKKTYTIEVTRKEAENAGTTETTSEVKFGLSSLEVKGQTLSPTFRNETYEYTIGLKEDLNSLEIEAKSSDNDATVEIIGNENLKQGENVITILVTNSKTNETATYQLIVNKNVTDEASEKMSWLKPSTWGKEEKFKLAIAVLLIMLIISAVVLKVKIAKEDKDDEDMNFPGAEELDKALTEHQELFEDDKNSKNDIVGESNGKVELNQKNELDNKAEFAEKNELNNKIETNESDKIAETHEKHELKKEAQIKEDAELSERKSARNSRVHEELQEFFKNDLDYHGVTEERSTKRKGRHF